MPRAFLCHASEDKPTVERLARELMPSGIDTFFDRWEIRTGDSIRQKVDAGIEDCTHFLVVLSPASVHKPWVNAELDAGFVDSLANRVRLMPLRLGLRPEQLPPLLRGLRSPSLDNFEATIQELVADIFGITERPPLGAIPPFAVRAVHDAGLSTVAGHIAAYFVHASEKGLDSDPQLPLEKLREIVGVGDDDIAEAVDELKSLNLIHAVHTLGGGFLGFRVLMPKARLFTALDSLFMPWNPQKDARTLAATLLNSEEGAMATVHLIERLGWTPRRVNPAITFLLERGAVEGSDAIDQDFESYYLRKNVQTRRFVRDGG